MANAQPEKMLGFPTHRVSGTLDTPEQLDEVLRGLAGAAFPDGAVLVLCGEEGARRIDASGEHHGLSGRLTRLAESLFADDDEKVRAEASLRAGKFIVAVPAPTDEEAERALTVLRAHGAHDLLRFGRWTTTMLDR